MREHTEKGTFKPTWKHQPTYNIGRVPDEFKETIVMVARLLDDGIINQDQIREWLEDKAKIQHLLRQAIVQPDPPRHLRGL